VTGGKSHLLWRSQKLEKGESGEPASDMVKAKSCIEGHSTTAGHVSNLPQPWVNETKETPQETGD